MREYVFKILVANGRRLIHIDADNIKDARKKFRQHMKENYKGELEWFLIAIYLKVY